VDAVLAAQAVPDEIADPDLQIAPLVLVDACFDDQFEQLSRCAYRVTYRLLGCDAEAQDAAQEAVARCYLRWDKVSSYADAWVSRVAANLVIDQLRRQQLFRRHANATDVALDPDTSLRLDLRQALARLPRRQREVVALRYLADQPEVAVAAALGCSVGTVKTHASRGLASLRKSWHGGLGEEV
jgi:RNA polymerase sigma factor (sigma-70 family)